MIGPVLLIVVGLLLWIAAANVDKWAAVEDERFVAVLLLIVAGIGCVIAGVVWLFAQWMGE